MLALLHGGGAGAAPFSAGRSVLGLGVLVSEQSPEAVTEPIEATLHLA